MHAEHEAKRCQRGSQPESGGVDTGKEALPFSGVGMHPRQWGFMGDNGSHSLGLHLGHVERDGRATAVTEDDGGRLIGCPVP